MLANQEWGGAVRGEGRGRAAGRGGRATCVAMEMGSMIIESAARCSLGTPLDMSSSGARASKAASGALTVSSTSASERTAGSCSTSHISL